VGHCPVLIQSRASGSVPRFYRFNQNHFPGLKDSAINLDDLLVFGHAKPISLFSSHNQRIVLKMAFRFRREGDFVKHRKKMTSSGMAPWVNDFKYRVIQWHSDFYMKDQARRAINTNQSNAEMTQMHFDSRVGEHQTGKGLSVGDKSVLAEMDRRGIKFSDNVIRYFNWRPFVPNVTPSRANSNPFCPVSANRTGWKEAPKRRSTDPQPMMGHQIAGTEDSVPIFPKFRG
jgi:hypothetical protein